MKNQSPLINGSAMIQLQLGKCYLKNSILSGKPILFTFFNSSFIEKIITIRSSKNLFGTGLIILTFCIGSIGNVFGQKRTANDKLKTIKQVGVITNEKELWKKEPFGNYDMASELLDKRDAFSKHFPNSAGSTTAHIASGPIHYQEGGQWKTIYHSIEPSLTGGFQNIHNSFKTYYPAIASGSIETRLPNGQVIYDMQDMRMYFEANGQEVGAMSIAGNSGKSDFNVLTYPSVYGSDIDLRLTQHTTMRKMDYILKNSSAISNAPQGAEYMVF